MVHILPLQRSAQHGRFSRCHGYLWPLVLPSVARTCCTWIRTTDRSSTGWQAHRQTGMHCQHLNRPVDVVQTCSTKKPQNTSHLRGQQWSSLRCWSWTSSEGPGWLWPPACPWCGEVSVLKGHWWPHGGNPRPHLLSEEKLNTVNLLPFLCWLKIWFLFLSHESLFPSDKHNSATWKKTAAIKSGFKLLLQTKVST